MNQKFDIYKLAVEMADRVSSRRLSANAFFVTVNTGLAGLFAFVFTHIESNARYMPIIIALIGMLLSLTWFFAIRSYKRLNKAKFEVIHELEKDLDFDYFTKEWAALKSDTKGADEPDTLRKRWINWKDRYTDLTFIEGAVPIVYGLVYLTLFLFACIGIGLK